MEDKEETKMDCVYLRGPGPDEVEFGQLDIPKPGPGQVLIKVEATPINQSELCCMRGEYDDIMNLGYPFVVGWEGAGTVVASGGGLQAWFLQGKRVSFTRCDEAPELGNYSEIKIPGTYAKYAITNAYQCVPIDDDMPFDQAATFFVNPLSAIGMVEEITNDKATSVVLTAAHSQICQMMIRLFKDANITVVAVVRKDEQVESLKERYGLEHVFNFNNEDFLEKYKEVVQELNCKHILDSVSGEIVGQMTTKMPKDSKLIVYGYLSKKNISGIDPYKLIGNRLVVKGWFVQTWMESKNLLKIILIIRKMKQLAKDHFASDIQAKYELKDIKEAMEVFEKNQSKGRIILKPWGLEN